MATDGNFVQPAIPKLNEHYDHWAMLMENFLRSKEYWNLIDPGIPKHAAEAELTENEKKTVEELKLKDLKVKNYLFQAIDRAVLETILKKETSKEIWDSLKQKYQGTARVKRAQLQALRREWEILQMKNGESVNDYFARTLTIANKMRMYGERVSDLNVIEKILRSMTSRYDYVVCSIEESHDLDTMTVDELQSSLLVHEQRINGHNAQDEQVLKVAQDETGARRGRGRGVFRGGNVQGRGRGRGGRYVDKTMIECYHCHDFGHFQYECPKKPQDSKANYVEVDEEAVLLMAQLSSDGKSNPQDMWFIDSGCSNHMTGRKDWFSSFDFSFSDEVKLGNNYSPKVAGKGTVKLLINGVVHLVRDVFYVPELKNNLFSVGQLQEKGLTVEMKQNKCRVFQEKGIIFETSMTTNRMFAVYVKSGVSQPCFQVSSVPPAEVWHSRYGHLSYSGLKTLLEFNMVKGLPSLTPPTHLCEHCLKGKHQRDPFPR
uniref:Retrovirus-related Pol polyprotein from transposon TNT 1-94 n=1 Tax=Cajanus cajan TaxID=3821 RepID=A0A151RPX2_CAJCA|nr:Retrovirus-related Pol polyprotein from transposon TNT 1-94 [Cajanus cajan]